MQVLVAANLAQHDIPNFQHARVDRHDRAQLVNLFAGYNTADGLWQTQLWAKNVANKGYLITTAANGAAPSGLSGAPRTFGLRVTRNF